MMSDVVLSRRAFCQTITLLPMLSSLSACAPIRSPLLIGHNDFLPYRFMQLAQQEGSDESVRLVLYESATMVAQAIASGSLHGGLLTLDEVMRLWSTGIDVQIAAVIDVSVGIDQLMVHPSISELAQLRDKKIAVETGAVGSVMLYKILQQAGLSETDVNIVYFDIAHHVEQYKNGDIDAVISFSPVSLQLAQMGAVKLFSSAQFDPIIVDVLVVQRSALSHYDEETRHLLSSYFETVTHWSKHDEIIVNRLSLLTGLDRSHLVDSLEGVQMMGAEQNRQWWSVDDTHLHSAVSQLAEILMLSNANVEEKLWRDDARMAGE